MNIDIDVVGNNFCNCFFCYLIENKLYQQSLVHKQCYELKVLQTNYYDIIGVCT